MTSTSIVQQPWENPVKNLLREGKPAIGVTITTSSVEAAAQAAYLGFDFLWIEMEHSPITLETLRHIVLATRGLKAVPFARVPVNELWTAKRVLDAAKAITIANYPDCDEATVEKKMVRVYRPDGTGECQDETYVKALTEKGKRGNRSLSLY